TCVSATLRLRSHATPKSNETSPEMPNRSALWSTWCARSAFFRSAFEGMQPTLRHTPPQYFSSMIATERPSCALRTAATYPPGAAAPSTPMMAHTNAGMPGVTSMGGPGSTVGVGDGSAVGVAGEVSVVSVGDGAGAAPSAVKANVPEIGCPSLETTFQVTVTS